MSTPHPELEALAELVDEPATGADDALRELREHVAGCPQCAGELQSLLDVRRTLRELPPVRMPDDVAARLDAAVRAAAEEAPSAGDVETSTVTVLPRSTATAPRRRPAPWFSPAAAAVLVLVLGLGGLLAYGLSTSGGSAKTSAGSTAASGPPMLASGTDYTAATIRSQVAALLLRQVPDAGHQYGDLSRLAASASGPAPFAAASAPAAASSAAASAPAASAPLGSSAVPNEVAAPAAPAGPLADPQALQSCVDALTGTTTEAVLVDYALFDGKPATIIVLPDLNDSGVLDVYVESQGADCSQTMAYFGRLAIAK